MISQRNKKGWQNPWVFGLLGLIFSGVAINGLFLWNALSEERSTLVDREYNTRNRKTGAEVVKEIEAQNALGWKATIKQTKAVPLNEPTACQVSILDREGHPVSGQLEVSAYRASDASKDFTVPFKEDSLGNYQGIMRFPLKGYWKLRIRVVRGKEVFETEGNRFSVKDIAAQNALAWKFSIKQPSQVVRGAPARYEVSAVDRQGLPVSGKMEVVAYYRASDVSQDIVIPFNEVSAGHYQGVVSFPINGDWELGVRLIRGKDVFETESDKISVADNK
jgi:nitrogen fixation protein FixH